MGFAGLTAMVWKHVARLGAIALLCLAWLAPAVAQEESPTASSVTDAPDYAPLVDSVERDYLQSTEGLTRYETVANFTPVTEDSDAQIAGKTALTYHNITGDSLDTIYFRLYPNSAEYAEGKMTVSSLEVDGTRIRLELGQEETLLTVPLPEPVADGASVELSYRFETVIPTDPRQSYGMFKYDTDTNTYALAHWQPLLAGWDPANEWNIGPISVNGDPVFTNAAVFDVTLIAPGDLIFATSGSALDRSANGNFVTAHYASGPSRDFVMAASADFEVQETEVGETTVRSFAWPGSENGSEAVLESGARAIEIYSDLIGLYPYEELDLIQVDIGNGAGGVEFPGLVYVGADFYDVDSDAENGKYLEFVVVHEVAHQWFYGVVGNNQYQHAFMDESLANYLSIVYFASAYGPEVANRQANLNLRLGYFDLLFDEGDQVVDQPTDDFPTMHAYGEIIYGKGALAFMELRREIGTDAFFAALQQYFKDFAFDVAQPEDLEAEFEQAAGEDLDAFWTHWFEEAAGEEDFDATDLARLLREIGE